ncbi:MAG: SDR family oxidoreductase [Candidatus Omnitrophica bacterium]|nr:SDR family oxidoreductase [Candidatus Omnitrophota bacterium]
MRILVTGGAGFIGSHLCERLLAEGHHVLCLDNFLTGDEENIAHLISNRSFELIRQSIVDSLELNGSLDTILHFASPASPPDYLKHPIETLKVGSIGTLNALELAKSKKAKFLLASTSEVYGDPLVHPQPESYWGNVSSIGPRSVYDEAKRFSEALTMAYHRAHGLDTRIVRIFNTFGPRMRKEDGRAIPNFITQALSGRPITVYGNGSQTRSFCYISDLVEGIRRLMDFNFHDPVNLGNPEEKTLLDLAKIIVRLTRSPSPLVFQPLPTDDPKQRCPQIQQARQKLNWAPKISLEDGLKETIAWFSKGIV